MGIINDNSILRLAEGAILPGGIDVVALCKVGMDFFQRSVYAFGEQLLVAAVAADLGGGGEEEFEFGGGEDDGADVAAVHDDAFAGADGLLLLYHGAAYGGEGAYVAYLLGDLHAADGFFYVGAVEVGAVFAFDDAEVDGDVGEGLCYGGCVMQVYCMLQEVEGDGAVHGAGVYVYVAEAPGEGFGEGAFTAGGVAIDGDDDWFV